MYHSAFQKFTDNGSSCFSNLKRGVTILNRFIFINNSKTIILLCTNNITQLDQAFKQKFGEFLLLKKIVFVQNAAWTVSNWLLLPHTSLANLPQKFSFGVPSQGLARP